MMRTRPTRSVRLQQWSRPRPGDSFPAAVSMHRWFRCDFGIGLVKTNMRSDLTPDLVGATGFEPVMPSLVRRNRAGSLPRPKRSVHPLDLRKPCLEMSRGVWESVRGGSRKWFPDQMASGLVDTARRPGVHMQGVNTENGLACDRRGRRSDGSPGPWPAGRCRLDGRGIGSLVQARPMPRSPVVVLMGVRRSRVPCMCRCR
jgi:hypothetical protein